MGSRRLIPRDLLLLLNRAVIHHKTARKSLMILRIYFQDLKDHADPLIDTFSTDTPISIQESEWSFSCLTAISTVAQTAILLGSHFTTNTRTLGTKLPKVKSHIYLFIASYRVHSICAKRIHDSYVVRHI
jgi:hypothetical protein